MDRTGVERASLLGWAFLSFVVPIGATALPTTQYTITVDEDNPRAAVVEARLDPKDGVLWMNDGGDQDLPHGWSTFVRKLEVTGSDGATVDTVYEPLSRWRLQSSGTETVSIRYEVLLQHDRFPLNFGDNGAAYYRDDAIMWSGRALFVAGKDTSNIELTLDLPAGWNATTPWLRIEGEQNRYTIDSTDDLVNSAIMIGSHTERVVRQGPLELRLALSGSGVAAAEDVFSSELAKYLKYYDTTIGPAPRRSMIVIAADSSYWGGEVMGRAISLLVGGAIDGPNPILAHLFAHEVAHLWGLDINFSEEDREELYWFYEGMLAEYLSYQAHYRLGEIDRDEYLAQLTDHYSKYQAAAKPGLSMSTAGHEKASHYDLIYSGGLMTAAALDQSVRESLGKTDAVNDLIRVLYTDYPSSSGSRAKNGVPLLDSDSISKIAAEIFSPEIGVKLRSWIDGSTPIPFDSEAMASGLSRESSDRRSDAKGR